MRSILYIGKLYGDERCVVVRHHFWIVDASARLRGDAGSIPGNFYGESGTF